MKKVMMFSSPTCAPCKMLKPLMETEANRRTFVLEIYDMKSANAPIFAQYGVRAAPTVICVEDGMEVGRFIGSQSAANIESILTEWGFAL